MRGADVEHPHAIYGWQKQAQPAPPIIERAQGIHLWDTEGKRYADLCAGQVNVNIGYGHPRVAVALSEQISRTCYVAPTFATEARLQLSAMVAARCPAGLSHVFFTNSGSESIENAIKIARAVTGRAKIYSAWQSYHGATAGASAISGDPRRHYVEPAMPGLGKFHYPSCYRCPLGLSGAPGCQFACLTSLKNQLLFEGPETVAAIVMEPISGTSGLHVPPVEFISGLRELCDQFGILLVFDETMSGWGRTGKWFACEHYGVTPDILVTAKGITSGYVPLGAVVVRTAIRDFFAERNFVGGLTNEAHPLACAAAIAVIETYEAERLIERSEAMGKRLMEILRALKERHPCIGDVRGKGLFACIELTSDRGSRSPLAGYRNSRRNVADEICRRLLADGLFVIAKWDYIFIAPPLTIDESDLESEIGKIDKVLDSIDAMVGAQ